MNDASSNSSKGALRKAAGGGVALVQADTVPRAARPLIEVKDLKVWYRLQSRAHFSVQELLMWRVDNRARRHWALQGVSFDCHEGDAVGIVGHNGAGKSTLCRVLSGILPPDSGSVQVRGEVTPLLNLGAGFNPDLTGRLNVYLYASFLGISRREMDRRMNEIIEFSGLGQFIDQPVRWYSSGMKSRLSFSVAATLDPKILILDEILSAGDREFRSKSRARMLEMMRHSRLLLIVSHSTGFLREMCNRVLWLDHGRVRRFGPAVEVIKEYDNANKKP